MKHDSKTTALITGASLGIGRELARVFARQGHDLVLVARSRGRLEELKAELEPKYQIHASVLVSDLSVPGACGELFGKVRDLGLHVDYLVNNAGIGLHGPFQENELFREMEMIQINITALTELSKLFLPGMIREKRGGILNVASTAAFQPGPLMAVYYATKAYVLFLSEAMHEELRGSGVTVTTLCPGPTRSEFQERAGIGHVKLFTYAAMAPEPVAEAGYRGLMRGKSLVIPGFLNQLTAFSTRLSPRWLLPRIVRWLQEERRKKPSIP